MRASIQISFRLALAALACAFLVPLAYAQGEASSDAGSWPIESSPTSTNFEKNLGQWDPEALYRVHTGGYDAYLTTSKLVLVYTEAAEAPAEPLTGNETLSHTAVFMHFDDALPPLILAGPQLDQTSNYLLGDSSAWITDVPHHESVTYRNLYPLVDLVYRAGSGQALEYDFIVKPGAAPDSIQLRFEGQEALSIDSEGRLVLETSLGTTYHAPPDTYQVIDGQRLAIASHYVLLDSQTVGFDVDDYDTGADLVIDPLVYSTMLGGSSLDQLWATVVDASGNQYVAGYTVSTNYPTVAGSFETTNVAGDGDGMVSKLNAAGTGLVYSTYLGGGVGDVLLGMTVDASGNAYVTGYTSSTNYPTTVGAYDTTKNGVVNGVDAVLTKIDPTGTGLVYSTFLGGAVTEWGYGVAVDDSGAAYVTGRTDSSGFPTTAGAFDTSLGSTTWDGFVTKFSPDGTTLSYSTLLGGTGSDELYSIAVDAAGNAHVTGSTSASTFPATTGAYDISYNSGFDAVVAKLNPAGSALLYATYLGGTGNDYGRGIAVDDSGQAYIVGEASGTFPVTTGAYQTTKPGGTDGFLARLSSTGATLDYSTYLGGASNDMARGVALGLQGVYIAGETASTNYPVTAGAQQVTKAAGQDAFLTAFDANLALTYSTFLGGAGADIGTAAAAGNPNDAYITGYTSSTFPSTAGAFQTTWAGNNDGFAARFGAPSAPQTLAAACAAPHGTSLTWTAPANPGAGPVSYTVERRAVYGSNLLSNGDLSTWPTSPGAPTSWTVGGSLQTWTRETDKVYANPNAAKVSISGSISNGGVWIDQPFWPTGSGPQVIDAWVATDGNGYPRLKVIDVTAGNVIIATVPGIQNGVAYNHVQTTLNLVGGNHYRVQVVNHIPSMAGEAFYVDEFRVRPVLDDTAYEVVATTSGTTYADVPAYQADGYLYRITASNAFGQSTAVTINHVPCDTQTPTVTGNPVNVPWAATPILAGVSWQDAYSGLSGAEYSVGSTSGATDRLPWTRMPAQPVASSTAAWTPSWTPTGLVTGTNYVNARVTDATGNQLTTSDAYVVQYDPAPPVISGNPQSWTWRTTIPTLGGVTWSDSGSGLAATAQYSIGFTSGATDVLTWTTMPAQPASGAPSWTPTWTPSTLGQGMNYVNVRVTDVAGTLTTFNGAYTVQYDTVQPTIASSGQTYTWRNTIPTLGTVNWQDTKSGLAATVQYSIGTTPGGTTVVPWTTLSVQPTNGQTTPWTPTWAPPSLAQGTNYVNLRVSDTLGNLGTTNGAYIIQYDTALPTVAGNPQAVTWRNTLPTLADVSWTDAVGGLKNNVQYSIGTTNGGTEVLTWTNLPTQPVLGQTTAWNPSWMPSTLAQGLNYVNVRVNDQASNQVTTNGAYTIQYDTALPSASGAPITTPWQSAATPVGGVSWQDTLGGLAASVQYSLGRSSGATDIATWATASAQPTSGQTTAWNPSWAPAGLAPGTNYVNVRVSDRAGNQVTTNGAYVIRVDVDAPTVAGNPQTMPWSKVNPTLSGVSWTDIGSGLAASAQYSIGSTSGGTTILAWTTMPAQPTAGQTTVWTPSWTPAGSLPQGLSYVNVRVTDVAGIQTTTNGAYLVRYETQVPTNFNAPTMIAWTNVNPTLNTVCFQDPLSGLQPSNGLRGWWRMDEASGTTMTDSSAGGSSGTLNGAIPNADGQFGRAYSFDGVNDYALTAVDTPSTAFSAAIWINHNGLSSPDGVRGLMDKRSAGNEWRLFLGNDGKLAFAGWETSTVASINAASSASIPTNSWHHVAVAYDGTTARFYIDGVQAGSGTRTGNPIQDTSSVIRFGTDALDADRYLQGKLDDAWVFDRALSAAEVATLHAGTPIGAAQTVGSLPGTTDYLASTILTAQPTLGQTSQWCPTFQIPSANLHQGDNYVTLRVGDQAGNPIDVQSYRVQYDTTPVANSGTQTVAWRNTAGSLNTVSFTDPHSGLQANVQSSISTTPGGSTTWTNMASQPGSGLKTAWTPNWWPSSVAQGTSYVSMRLTDVAGNVRTIPDVYIIQYETAAPSVAGNGATTPWQKANVPLTGVTWTDSSSGLATTAQYSVGTTSGATNVMAWTTLPSGNQPPAGSTNPWTPSFTPTTLNPGTNYVNMRVTDTAGNLLPTNGAWIVRADSVLPTITPRITTPWVSTMPALSGVSVQDSLSGLAPSIQYSIGSTNGTTNVKAWTNLPSQPGAELTSSWPLSWTPSATLQQGLNWVNVRVTDVAGNLLQRNGAYVIQFDSNIESITGLVAKSQASGSTLPSSWQADNTPRYEWNVPGSVSPLLGYSITQDGTTPNGASLQTANFLDRAGQPLGDGIHVFQVRAKDTAGNLGPVSSMILQVDATAPALMFLASPTHAASSSFYNQTNATVTWSYSEPTSSLQGYYYILTTGTCPASLVSTGTFLPPSNTSLNFTGLWAFGSYRFCVQAQDAAGNLSPVAWHNINVDAIEPQITSVQPSDGSYTPASQGIVRLEFNDVDGGLDPGQLTTVDVDTIQWLIDDIDVLAVWGPICIDAPLDLCRLEVTPDYVLFQPPVPFAVGNHTVQLSISDQAIGGNNASMASYFVVDAANTTPTTGDWDGDQVTDTQEHLICDVENDFWDADGTCTTDGTDWLPPHLAGLLHDVDTVVETVEELVFP